MTQQQADLESIFAAALVIETPEQQRAFLDEACGGDQPLRARVEALLRSSRDAGSFLEQPAVGLAATIASAANDTVDESGSEVSLAFLTPSDKPGCLGTLGQYEAVEVVGRGGMGVVLRAYDTKLNRVVAIKVMAPELAVSPTAVKRFLREARAAAAISHDHVVTIHAINETNHPPFLVMEFVDGPSLQDKIDRQGCLELKEILRIGVQTAAGLSAAHKQGLVHRDIKPANILLENGVERVKITDFGLARAADDVSVTQTGQIAGTPQFMSPEQAQGHPLDARSDLFSLGSVLYTMCTGRPPFRAETAVATLRRVCDDEPRPIREVNSETPDWLEAIVGKLLAKDLAERFQSAEEVAECLGAHLAHLQHPMTIPQPPPVEMKQTRPFNVNDELSFVHTSQCVYAVIAMVWAVLAIVFGAAVFAAELYWVSGNFSATLFKLSPPLALITGVVSAITSAFAFLGTWHVKRRESYYWALVGNMAALLPVNPLLIFAVPWSLAAIFKLRHPDVRRAFQNHGELTESGSGGSLREPKPLAESEQAVFTFKTSRRFSPLAAVLLAGLGLAFAAWMAVVVYVETNYGIVRVKVLDPGAQVTIRHDHDQMIEIKGYDVWVPPGETYLHIKHGELEFETEKFTVRRGDKLAVLVERFEGSIRARLEDTILGARSLVEGADKGNQLTNSLGMTMRLIPAGEFTMGSDQMRQLTPDKDWFFADFVAARRTAETPRHRVTLTKPYYLATHEVTVGQFRRFMDDSGYETTAEQERGGYGWRNAVWQEGAEFNWKNPGFPQPDEHPVCNVSWDDAVAFCRWLSQQEGMTYRLPTEAEWEYACRAGTTTLFSTGDNPHSLRGAANLADASLCRQKPSVTWAVAWDDGHAATAPVGSFAPNAFGLYDMHGNVWEWCEDEYDSGWYEKSPAADPVRRGSAELHVYRGGGWDNWPGFLRSADRYSSHSPTLRTEWAGFRVVREIDKGD